MSNNFPIPVLFIIFNRPETTRNVFDVIKKIKPEKLFIAADGPRDKRLGEKELCGEVRKITENIDWPCEVFRKYEEKNLGCKLGVSSAINWFFKNVEKGIILEDDCLPDPTFFVFCEEMLTKYNNNKEIMHINGTNSQFGEKFGIYSYYFSHCPQVWGWATWKRAWDKYDIEMKELDIFIHTKKTLKAFKNKQVANYWNSLFKYIKEREVNTWDAQWSFSVMNNSGLVITPNVNLVKNIGFSTNSTHTENADKLVKQDSKQILKIENPPEIIIDNGADIKIYQKIYYRSFFERIMSFVKKILSVLVLR